MCLSSTMARDIEITKKKRVYFFIDTFETHENIK